ncbi:MAG: flagellar basal body L-ring protein FlgH [Pseudomonadota bacterium]
MRSLLNPAVSLGVLLLTGCAGQLDHLGKPPTVSAPGAEEYLDVPTPSPERVALSSPPASAPPPLTATPASLWRSGPSSLFGDRRAKGRGDILTVVIEIDEEAEISNTTARGRSGDDEISVSAFLGIAGLIETILPQDGTLDPAVRAGSSQNSQGTGSISREEEITLRLAATVERVLPNGHLAIRGSQEIRINFELREIQVSGIVRPEDITRTNEITLEKIADARIVYGGRGQITDLQQPRYGQQIVDLVSPF